MDELLAIERALGGGTGDTLPRAPDRRRRRRRARRGHHREQTAFAIDATPGWDEFEISRTPQVIELTPDSAILTYRWSSRRGDETYEALMSSVYVRRERRLEARPAPADAGQPVVGRGGGTATRDGLGDDMLAGTSWQGRDGCSAAAGGFGRRSRSQEAQRKPIGSIRGSSGLTGRPGGGSGRLYGDGATSFGVSGWNSDARYWMWPRPGPSSNWPPP